MADTFLIILYTLRISVLLIVSWVLHTKIGVYPQSLPTSENPKREIREMLLLWAFMFAVASIFAFLVYTSGIFDPSDQHSPVLLVTWALVYTLPGFAIPFLFVVFVNKWKVRADLGITTTIQQKRVWIFVILIQILLILAELSIRGSPETAPLFFLLISLYATVFIEEFLYRGVIQS
ncbi:MAG: hypothetical protein ACXABY_21645 [Candidatus Thorarchaeota archaeon]|jgi:membrane protease YdiL (CAAX protease family)